MILDSEETELVVNEVGWAILYFIFSSPMWFYHLNYRSFFSSTPLLTFIYPI